MDEEPKIINGGMAVDDRGNLKFCNEFDFKGIKRFYQVENLNTDIIRGFHGHLQESKWVWVSKGTIKIVTVQINQNTWGLDKDSKKTFILSSKKPSILHIPKGYAHGFKCLEKGTTIIFFSNKFLGESKDDDYRFKWDTLGTEIWECENR